MCTWLGMSMELISLCKLRVGNSSFIDNTSICLYLCGCALTVEYVASAHVLEDVVKEGVGASYINWRIRQGVSTHLSMMCMLCRL